MNATVAAAVVGAVALLLGAALTYLGQFSRTKKEHKWAIETAKRDAYAEFLKSISVSYAQAKSEAKSRQGHESETKSSQTEKPQGPTQESHKTEEADLRAATARIVLLAKREIYEKASHITEQAIEAHNKLRSGDSAAQDAVDAVDRDRLALIEQFKDDLGIPHGDQPQHQNRIKLLIRRMRLANSDAQLAEERALSAAQLQEERKLAQDREQLAEAYLVQVIEAQMTPEVYGSRISSDPDTPIECPVAIVVNRGHYTITRLEAQICLNGNTLTSYGKTEHFTSWWTIAQPIKEGLSGLGQDIYLSTLTPVDLGMRYSHDAKVVQHLIGSYPIVRWTDRWGTRWEHKRGEVRQIKDGDQWLP